MISMYQLMIMIRILGAYLFRYSLQLHRCMALDAGCDYHPGNFAADWCLLPARQPTLVCRQTPFC
ncbi:hypothetical protein ACLB1O_29220 [Escherichia coli]